jgi:hypothetical protein
MSEFLFHPKMVGVWQLVSLSECCLSESQISTAVNKVEGTWLNKGQGTFCDVQRPLWTVRTRRCRTRTQRVVAHHASWSFHWPNVVLQEEWLSGCLQWPSEYLTRIQTLNYHLESKAISISIQISRAIQDLLDYLPNIPAQLEILIPWCLLTLVGMRSMLMKTYHCLQRSAFRFKHLFRTQSHPQAHIRHITHTPYTHQFLQPFAANCYYTPFQSQT